MRSISSRVRASALALVLLATGVLTGCDPAPPAPHQAFQITYRAANGDLISTAYTQAGGWHTETVPLGLDLATNSSPGAATYKGNFHIVYRAATGALVNTWWTPGVGWKTVNVPGTPAPAGDVSATSYGNAFHIVYRDVAGRLINTRYTDANGWEPQVVPVGEPLASNASPDVTTWGDDLHISYRSAANHVINTRYDPVTGWSSEAVGVQAAPGSDVTNAGFGTSFHLAYRAAGTNHLRDVVYTAANGWSESSVPVGLNMATNASPDLAAHGDELHVTYRAAQGDLVNTWWDPTTGWHSNSVPVGPAVAGDPSAVTYLAAATPTPPGGLISPPNLGGANSLGYYWLPSSSPAGLYTTKPDCRWGSKALINTIYTTATWWHQSYPGSPLVIRDLNGPASVHASHANGVDVDVSVGHLTTAQKADLGRLFARTGTISIIGYNGTGASTVKAAVEAETGGAVVQFWDGHTSHFHVRIAPAYRGPTSRTC